MKSLHVIGSKSLGGAEHSFSRITSGLQKTGMDVEVAIRHGSDLTGLMSNLSVVHTLPMRTVWDPLSRISLALLVRRRRPDIVQTYMGRATRLLHLPKERGVVHVARLCGNYNPRYFAHAHAWVACTKWVADLLIAHGIPAPQIRIIPNFLPSQPPSTAEDLVAARRAWDLTECDTIVAAVGRLHPVKGFDILLKAFAKLPHEIEHRRLCLVIAGDGDQRASLMRLASELELGERVRFLGWTQRPDLVLRNADVVAFTSHENEGFGNISLETWAAGTPLVTTRSKGALEVTQHRQTAWQVDCGDEVGLANGIREVLSDSSLAKELVRNGAQTLANHYSEAAVIAQYCAFYEELLQSRGNG